MLLSYQKPDGSLKTVRLKTISAAKPVTIGRGDEATLTLEDPKCSRVHAAIRYWDDIFVIRDMNSRNGVYINGKQIDVAQLNPGDTVKLGDTEINVAQDQKSGSDVTMAC